MSEPTAPPSPAPVAPVSLPAAIEQALVNGNLKHLTTEQRAVLYHRTCESLNLNPLTQPFCYFESEGQLHFYATRNCADQLRYVHQIRLQVVSRELVGDCYVVHTRAELPNGRTDEDLGVVSVAGLRGQALANGMMRAITKSKRRVTLSIVGLSLLDETEAETIPGVRLYAEASPPALPAPDPEQPDQAEQPDQPAALPPAPRIGGVDDFWRAAHALVGGTPNTVAGAVAARLGSEAGAYKARHGITWSNVYTLLENNVVRGEPIPGAPPSLGGTAEDYGCAMCGEPLKTTRYRDGTEWTPAQLAAFGTERHGMVLCYRHYREANSAKRPQGDQAEAVERGIASQPVPF